MVYYLATMHHSFVQSLKWGHDPIDQTLRRVKKGTMCDMCRACMYAWVRATGSHLAQLISLPSLLLSAGYWICQQHPYVRMPRSQQAQAHMSQGICKHNSCCQHCCNHKLCGLRFVAIQPGPCLQPGLQPRQPPHCQQENLVSRALLCCALLYFTLLYMLHPIRSGNPNQEPSSHCTTSKCLGFCQ
jgi:hypothetical protein